MDVCSNISVKAKVIGIALILVTAVVVIGAMALGAMRQQTRAIQRIDVASSVIMQEIIPNGAEGERVSLINAAVQEVSAANESMRRTLLTGGLSILLAMAGSAVFLRRSVTGPLGELSGVMRALANGRVDVDVGFAARQDEIGQMAQAARTFQDAMIEIVRLQAEREQLCERAEQDRRQALVRMADTVEKETRFAVDRVAGQTGEMSEHAATMTASAQDVSDVSQDLAAAADQAFTNAKSVAAATEELSASIQEIGAQVETAAEVTRLAVNKSDSARGSIEKLSQAVDRIGAVAELIKGFASETNLLALNATIEAVRAGEAGRGFAVVAAEVKNLATGTARSTGEIAALLSHVRDATAAAVGTVAEVAKTITEVSQISAAIAAAIEQQGATAGELARTGAETCLAARHVSTSASRAAAISEAVQTSASRVESVALDMSVAVDTLRQSLVRIVRSATPDVDRRTHPRIPVDVGCLLRSDLGRHRGRVRDVSQGGALLVGFPEMTIGDEGHLQIDGYDRSLPFVARFSEPDRLHVQFRFSAAEAEAFSHEFIPACKTGGALRVAA